MTNPVHLLLKTGWTPVATVMRSRFQAGLPGNSVQFNRRHKSYLGEEDPYLPAAGHAKFRKKIICFPIFTRYAIFIELKYSFRLGLSTGYAVSRFRLEHHCSCADRPACDVFRSFQFCVFMDLMMNPAVQPPLVR